MADDFRIESIRNTHEHTALGAQTNKEHSYAKDIVLSSDVFLQMAQDLDEFGGTHLEQEYLLFSSDGSVVDVIVPVGSRLNNRIAVYYKNDEKDDNPTNIFHVIKQNLDKGLMLVGDYHMHPSETGKVMQENGFHPEDGASPSISDISLPISIKEDFGIPMVRIIGGIMDGHKTFRAFNILRIPNYAEVQSATFSVDEAWSDEDMSAQTQYTNSSMLKELKIIEEIPIKVNN